MSAETLLTRRRFLKLAGISLLGSAAGMASAGPAEAYCGRALEAAPVYLRLDASTTPIIHLWPDSITPIRESVAGWYRSDSGFIPRSALQPIRQLPATPQAAAQPPFWAEVIAPVAALRSFCTPDAPLISRIGHGGAMQVIECLPGPIDWYGVAAAGGDLVGWSQALHWRPVDLQARPLPDLEILLDQRQHQLTVTQAGQAIVQAPFASSQTLPAGYYTIEPGAVGGQPSPTGHEGAAWQTMIGSEYSLSGVYWHNRFGEQLLGPDVQVTPMLARWLYQSVQSDSCLRVYS